MHQGLALANPTEGQEVRITEAVADVGGLAEGGTCGRGVALAQALECQWHEQISLLHTVLVAVEQPPGPSEPAIATGQFTLDQVAEGQPECAPSGSRSISQAQALVMRPRPYIGALAIPADQMSGHRKPLKVLKLKGRVVIHGG
jgi:hypothetical protein